MHSKLIMHACMHACICRVGVEGVTGQLVRGVVRLWPRPQGDQLKWRLVQRLVQKIFALAIKSWITREGRKERKKKCNGKKE